MVFSAAKPQNNSSKMQLPVLVLCGLLITGGHAICKKKVEKAVRILAKAAIMDRFYIEEMARANGHSGIKTMRLRSEGTRPYHATHHADDYTTAAIHDHPDFVTTCGMGEVVVVMNGVEFMTRHNDFLFAQKSRLLKTFGVTEIIPYSEVPQTVKDKPTIAEQIDEMRMYFKAWKQQDPSIRPYKDYFQANLCYMEAAYTLTPADVIQESFNSTRHWLDADSWDDLFQKTRFSSYSGTKDNKENYAFLPTTIWNFDEKTFDFEIGQWNYRILCHPLKNDLPLNRLRAVDDLKTRMSLRVTYEEYLRSRNARFILNPNDQVKFCDGATKFGLLDELMEEIPGADNYGAVLHDEAFDNTIRRFDAGPGDSKLNAAYFHRWMQNDDNGAMGVKIRHRGLNDENLFAAMNTQKSILPTRVEKCTYDQNNKRLCKSWEQRWTYAIPLEIIYNTPINGWNPYDIDYKGAEKSTMGQTILAGGRDGSTSAKAFDGTNSATYYQTPDDFFTGTEIGGDPADTPKDFVFVMDKKGVARKTRASGIRTFLPDIPGVGILRQRYPIAPVYGEGSAVWKELSALSDIVMEPAKYSFMIRNPTQTDTCPKPLKLRTGPSNPPSSHTHEMILNPSAVDSLNKGQEVTVVTEAASGHTHTLVLKFVGSDIKYTLCSGKIKCGDGHPDLLIKV